MDQSQGPPKKTKYPQLADKAWLTEQLRTKQVKQVAREVGCHWHTVYYFKRALEDHAPLFDSNGNKLCGAKTRQKGAKNRCSRPAGWGVDVGYGFCKLHAGQTKTGLKRSAKERAVEIINTYGLPVDTTATEALEGELKRTAGHVAWLQTKIAETPKDDDLVYSVGGGQNTAPAIEPSVWVRLYQAERKHLTDVAKACHAVGIDERRVQLAEQQGQLLAQAVQGMLRELGVEHDPRTPRIVRKYLMLAQGGVIESDAVEVS